MKLYAILIMAILISSCKNPPTSEVIPFIEGYWEIKSVEMGDGTLKEFKVNTSVDFIELNGDSGVRKKLMPRLDGTFREFPSNEKFKVLVQNDSLLMQYQTPYATWTETVIRADDSLLVVRNHDNKEYVYRRYKKPEVIE
ncbi:MAG: hypothetical protein AAFP76_02895 [Bacteroidota bacterium]